MSIELLGFFGSDNHSGVCKELMQALSEANQGTAYAYGGDPYTKRAKELFKKSFGKECEAFFVLNGTGANVSALRTILGRAHSILCADTAHIQTQETAAIYALSGSKLLTIPSSNGKIGPEEIEKTFLKESYWGVHASIPKVVCISQSTEFGTIYTLEEIKQISAICKRYNLLLFVDGCRLANAVESLRVPLNSFGSSLGIDVMTFGGSKNGMMFGEAVLFFRQDLAEFFPFIQKQSLQLLSKMRYISAQFIPYLEKELWKRNAEYSNNMAKHLEDELKKIPGAAFCQKRESNQLFFSVPDHWVEELKKHFIFHVWDTKPTLRLITSFDTKEEEISAFVSHVKKLQGAHG